MLLTRSRAVAPGLRWAESIASTNTALLQGGDDLAVIATDDQSAGRGRLGRTWVAPPGRTLAVSVLVADPPGDRLGWLPLVAGVAMARAVRTLVPAPVTVKWPNDVQVDGLKVSGILTELGSRGAVVGAGLNLTLAAGELPTTASTSLALQGADPHELLDRALAAYLSALFVLVRQWRHGDVRDAVRADCGTLGRRVRLELPGGVVREGVADELDEQGRLVVGGIPVAAGDVTHLRPA